MEPVNTNPVTGCGQVCLTLVIERELVSLTLHIKTSILKYWHPIQKPAVDCGIKKNCTS